MGLSLSVRTERFALADVVANARNARVETVVVVAELCDGRHRGRGECVAHPRFGETTESVIATIAGVSDPITKGLDRETLQVAMPAGAARNALDCAFWDFEAKLTGKPIHVLANLPAPRPVLTAYTISFGSAEEMAAKARAAAWRPLLKLKLGGRGDPERIRAVRDVAPKAELIVDANESWSDSDLAENLAACATAGVTQVEQPLGVDQDAALATTPHSIVICADESVTDTDSLARLTGKYDSVNVKLDKAGGLTEALKLAAKAQERRLGLMVGCRLGTSLAIAPAILLAQQARVNDLDGPLLLAADRPNGLRYDGAVVYPADTALWG